MGIKDKGAESRQFVLQDIDARKQLIASLDDKRQRLVDEAAALQQQINEERMSLLRDYGAIAEQISSIEPVIDLGQDYAKILLKQIWNDHSPGGGRAYNLLCGAYRTRRVNRGEEVHSEMVPSLADIQALTREDKPKRGWGPGISMYAARQLEPYNIKIPF